MMYEAHLSFKNSAANYPKCMSARSANKSW